MIERLRDLWRRISMAQQSRLFKSVATVIVPLTALVNLAPSARTPASSINSMCSIPCSGKSLIERKRAVLPMLNMSELLKS